MPKNLEKLQKLETLACAFNSLDKLPENLYFLKNLKTVYAHHNRLYDLPKLPTTIQILDIGHNYFGKIPPSVFELKNLEEFDISFNQMEEFPMKIKEIYSLKKLYWSNNKFLANEKYQAFIDEMTEKIKKSGGEVH